MARKTSSTTRLSLAALALSGALACDRGEQAGDPPVTKSESPAKPDKAAPPEADPLRDPELITNKLGPYAACINTTRPFVARHYRRYTDRVEGDGALKRGAKGPAPAALPEAALTPCEKALREGKHLSPPLPEVEAAAAEYDTRTREYAALASKAGLPSNFDAWDGYPAARKRVLSAAQNADIVPADIAVNTALLALQLLPRKPSGARSHTSNSRAQDLRVISLAAPPEKGLVWGMFAEYLLDYYAEGPAAFDATSITTLLDEKSPVVLALGADPRCHYHASIWSAS